ncbi:MAG: FAD-dependent oxidoreductase [Actinomycetota bacterium]|nr:FAD-dependent oxidoreductase [Actinomycetota bacterium]
MAGEETPDIIVVGAGLSGLTAARDLMNAGLEVRVLESRNRPGGRTWVTEAGGVTVDLGGEWVDEAHVEIRGLIEELGIEIYPYERRKENAHWYIDGEISSEMPFSENDAKVYENFENTLVEIATDVDPETYWRDTPSDDVSVERWLREAGMSQRGIHVVETLISSCGSTVPPEKMSMYSYAIKISTRGGPGKGNEYRVRGGAGSVAQALARELEGRIEYSSPVTEIRQNDDGAEVRWMTESGMKSATARRIILAVPFTCYPTIRFDPEPPPMFGRMISTSTYGVVRKMAFIFDTTLGATHFTVTDTPLGYLGAAQDTGSTEESRGIVSFAAGSPLLAELGFTTEERKRRAVELLRTLYDAPEPKQVLEHVWAHDYWTRGSYMIVAPGELESFGEAMGGTFGSVHLAGAESISAAPSFMNSAVKGGQRAASDVVKTLSPARASMT